MVLYRKRLWSYSKVNWFAGKSTMSLILSRALAPPTVLMRSVRRLLEAKKFFRENAIFLAIFFMWNYYLFWIAIWRNGALDWPQHNSWPWPRIWKLRHKWFFDQFYIQEQLYNGSMKKYYSKGVMVLLVLIENNYFLFWWEKHIFVD